MRYGFNKLWTQNPRASCSACELTHGGLRLSANEGWEGYRRDLEKRGFIVQMRHRDEIPAQVCGIYGVFGYILLSDIYFLAIEQVEG